MASQAEQLAQSFNFGNIARSSDLLRRVWFTLLCLLVFRLGIQIPIPGVDPLAVQSYIDQAAAGTMIGQLNLFTGGALQNFSIFTLSIIPYISASIIVQLMRAMIPKWNELHKEGEAGRRKLNQYTRYLTVALAVVQALGTARVAEGLGLIGADLGEQGVQLFRITAVTSLTGGTMFLLWLGEQIQKRGIGNGVSLLIFVGIIANLPGGLFNLFATGSGVNTTVTGGAGTSIAGNLGLVLLILLVGAGLLLLVVYAERSFRKVPIQYPDRQMGMKQFQGDTQYLPLKLNTAGVIPAIFASSLLFIPGTIDSFTGGAGAASDGEGGLASQILEQIGVLFGAGSPGFVLLFIALIMFFTFFYTSIVFDVKDTAENLKRNGGFVPGLRPGQQTAAYLDFVLTRVTVVGAAYLAFVCAAPYLLGFFNASAGGLLFGGTAILIVVAVTIDLIGQVHGHLVAEHYRTLMQRSGLRGQTRQRDTKRKKKPRRSASR